MGYRVGWTWSAICTALGSVPEHSGVPGLSDGPGTMEALYVSLLPYEIEIDITDVAI